MNGTKLTGKIGHIKKELKLLLYCTKSKPRLFFDKLKQIFSLGKIKSNNDLNGKIVAECDFEVEKIIPINVSEDDYDYGLASGKNLLKGSCLYNEDICEYLDDYDGETIFKKGYAIHIKNLHIFDKPKELDDYYYSRKGKFRTLGNAPQNMMYVYDNGVKKILISIQPQWMCLILNHIKDVEVRRVVLKEMINNG